MEQRPGINYFPVGSLPAVVPPDSYDKFRSQATPLIIDNGSTHLRFGFSTSPNPHTNFNVVAKYKERKYNKPLLLFGDAIDTESGAKSQAKTPWEGDVLLNFDALVCMLTTVDGDPSLNWLFVTGKRSRLRVYTIGHRRTVY